MTILRDELVQNQQPLIPDQPLPAESYLVVEQSPALAGQAELVGAKNAVLVIIASLILTDGTSVLDNVPDSDDVHQMMALLVDLGAQVQFYPEKQQLIVNTTTLNKYSVRAEIMRKIRASALVLGPLLARFTRAEIALPGGDQIGARPIDIHLKNFMKMGATVHVEGDIVTASASKLEARTLVLDYPSVGATENLMMAAAALPGTTKIIHAALEPEVLDLAEVLKKMGAKITIEPPMTMVIEGTTSLQPIEHTIMNDRLEAGSLLLAAAITGGQIELPHADPNVLDVFLLKLEEMGHHVRTGMNNGKGISLVATSSPRAVSFVTSPYPGFPTDLQAPMMAALCLAQGQSVIHETVYENRMLHVRELQKMGANIKVEGDKAKIMGVDALYGAHVIAGDIRGSCSLVLAGLAAQGKTIVTGVHHFKRGYQALDKKLASLGARITLKAA
jgi:UDP-N-acetylglucosamine 1-carboxyvinyltransferase